MPPEEKRISEEGVSSLSPVSSCVRKLVNFDQPALTPKSHFHACAETGATTIDKAIAESASLLKNLIEPPPNVDPVAGGMACVAAVARPAFTPPSRGRGVL